MFKKYIEKCSDLGKKYYPEEIANLTDVQRDELLNLLHKMENAGCTSPLKYAFSEISRGKPQFARFLVYKELFEIAENIETAMLNAKDYAKNSEYGNEHFEETCTEIEKAIGKEKLYTYLKAYNKGIISSFMSLIDEGNNWRDSEDGVSWALVKTDENGIVQADKFIEGLLEDFYSFKN